MQSYPRQSVAISNPAFIQGLMLVPDEGDVEGMSHRSLKKTSSCTGLSFWQTKRMSRQAEYNCASNLD